MIKSNPTFVIYVGPMFSGKTSRLLSDLERFKYQKKKTLIFKPQIDDRYSQDEVVSHSGWHMPATTIKLGADILGILADVDGNPDIIAVDEAFMIPGIAEALVWLFRNGFSIVVSTLDLSATGKAFHEVEKMLVWATRVEKCAAVCTVCGQDAFYTHKKNTDGEEIEVGGDELYEPRCSSHHIAIDLREKIHQE